MLEELTERFRQRVDGKDAIGFNVKFDLGDTGIIFVAGGSVPIEVSNDNGDADTTFIMSAEDLTAMVSGELPPMNAYMQGKMKVVGDVGKAMQFGTIFGQESAQ
jgi:putative sterol carrier protein